MLEALDTVPWRTLEHAYGEASEVPRLIRDLASSQEEVRQAAQTTLGFTVYHQGTVYSSTAYVVPFFCELLEATQREEDKFWFLTFFIDIACASSALEVDVTLDPQRNAEVRWVKAAKEAVSASYSTYLRLLEEEDAKLRAYAALTLGLCQSHADQVIPTMREHLVLEEAQMVRASILLSLGQLMPWNEQTHTFFMQLLGDQTNPVERIAAAIACAFSAREATPPVVVQVLLEGFEQPSSVGEAFRALPYAEYDLHVCLSQAFRAIGLALAPVVVPTLLYALKRSDYFSALVLVDHLLYFALEGKTITSEMTAANLTEMQREVLWALVGYEDLWEFSEMSFTVGKYFPPRSIWKVSPRPRNEIVALLGEKNREEGTSMANRQQLSILKQGTLPWNEWRKKNPDVRPDLQEASLADADLRGANLSGANLSGADLRSADLHNANLYKADLYKANLREANLSGANLSIADLRSIDLSDACLRTTNLTGANLGGSTLSGADLSYANLSRAFLADANLSGVDLRGANLSKASLNRANLSGADLRGANLTRSILIGTDLNDVNLSGADLRGAYLAKANLTGVNITKAWIGGTTCADFDLSTVRGWETLKHGDPPEMTIDFPIDTPFHMREEATESPLHKAKGALNEPINIVFHSVPTEEEHNEWEDQ